METVFVYTREQAIADGVLMRFTEFFLNEQKELTHEQKIRFCETMGRLKTNKRKPKFSLGELIITTNAATKLDSLQAVTLFMRHECGDWGEVCEEDWQSNEESLRHDMRLMSVYYVNARDGEPLKVYVITEWNREATTILLPEDYLEESP